MKHPFFKTPYLLTAFFMTLFFVNCDNEDVISGIDETIDAVDCSQISPTYFADIQTIFDMNCSTAYCHFNGSSPDALSMTGYENLKTSFGNFNILCAINHEENCKSMPQGQDKLSDADILLITCWVKNGFLE